MDQQEGKRRKRRPEEYTKWSLHRCQNFARLSPHRTAKCLAETFGIAIDTAKKYQRYVKRGIIREDMCQFDFWSKQKQQEFIADAQVMASPALAKKYHTTKNTALSYLRKFNLRSEETKKRLRERSVWKDWSEDRQQQFLHDAMTDTVHVLSQKYGIAPNTCQNWITKFGIKRSPEFYEDLSRRKSQNMKQLRDRSRRRAIMGLDHSYPVIFNREQHIHMKRARNNMVYLHDYICLDRNSRTLYYDEQTKRSLIMEYRYGRGAEDLSFKDQHRFRYFNIMHISEADRKERVAAKHDFYNGGEIL